MIAMFLDHALAAGHILAHRRYRVDRLCSKNESSKNAIK
jgi:hypothetical protein